MIVTIPKVQEHEGFIGNLGTYEISDNCQICGSPRGEVFKGLSYDGSRRLEVDCWINKCGHVDCYSAVRKEGKLYEKVGKR